jgi:putative sterol carrier protein
MGRHPVAVVNLHITYARTVKVDYYTFIWGGLYGKLVATWKGKTGTIPAFAVGPRKTKKNLCRYISDVL